MLAQGGDARIAVNLDSGHNKYGCQPFPDEKLIGLGSSTASVISAAGFTAADDLRRRLVHASANNSRAVIYACELDRVRSELKHLCGVADLPGVETVFAASGTDLHLIAAQLCGQHDCRPLLTIMIDAAETGSGVRAALAGRHFSSHTALGDPVDEGGSIGNAHAVEVVSVSLRCADGLPRAVSDIDAEVEAMTTDAVTSGWRVLLIMVDVSKTGIIAPSPASVIALRQRFPAAVDVFVDACQFRIAPTTLRAYLCNGFMVAVTGSKFITGPTFAGALLLPSPLTSRARLISLPKALSAYSARAEWPRQWAAARTLREFANFGLLLRWEAALRELRAFRRIPEYDIAQFLQEFASAVQQRLRENPFLEPLPVPKLDRWPLVDAVSWDVIPTIFPFLLHRTTSLGGRIALSGEETVRIYQSLAQGEDENRLGPMAGPRYKLGQPVSCGQRDGVPVSALRVCSSARLVVDAFSESGSAAMVISKAVAALDQAARLAQQ